MGNITGAKKFDAECAELNEELNSRLDSDDLPPANIIVAGITGTGKSTLINAVFGSEIAATGTGKPVTSHINEYVNDDIPIHIWDTVGLELDSEKTRESIKAIRATIASKASAKDKFDRIHAIWYCINSASSRYQGAELNFIKELYSIGVPFIIVLTQCSGDEAEINAFENEIRKINLSMGMDTIEVVQVLAKPVAYRGMSQPIPKFGLDTLVNVTLKLLPDFIKNGFIAAQKISLSEKRSLCEEIICKYVQAAQNGFWHNIALINVLPTDKSIEKLLYEIAKIYNNVLPENRVEQILSGLHVSFNANFWGLISPIDMGYSRKITELLAQKKKDGFSVEVADVDKNRRAARMIAFFGYIFLDAVEDLQDLIVKEQLKNIDEVIAKLVELINKGFDKNKRKAVRGR